MPRVSDEPVRAFIGLGSNLHDPLGQLEGAFEEIGAIRDTHLVARSRCYRNPPLGPADQPDYINAVAEIRTALPPLELLDALQAIEARHGRVRGAVRWGPRTLDLDLLLYGERRLESERLVLPHPGMRRRPFVLHPLFEVAPDLRMPGGELLREWVAQCPRANLIAVG